MITAPLWVITSQLRQQINNPKLTPVLPGLRITKLFHSDATKQSNPKESLIKIFNKTSLTQKTEEHPYSVVTNAKFADKRRHTGTPCRLQTPRIPAQTKSITARKKKHSNTPQFSTKPSTFANISKTQSSEFLKLIDTVSNKLKTSQDFSLLSDSSNPLSSQCSSLTPSKIASTPFTPPQRQEQKLNAYYHELIGTTQLIWSINHRLLKVHCNLVFKVLHS